VLVQVIDYGYDGWFADRLCECEAFKFHPELLEPSRWTEDYIFTQPYTCRDCGKWQRRMLSCVQCHQYFYKFFRHPSQGFHVKPKKGWYCWNCCDEYNPPVVEPEIAKLSKIPPPDVILPPGYVLYVEPQYF